MRGRLAAATVWTLVVAVALPLATGSTWSRVTATTSNPGNQLTTAAAFDWEPVPASATTTTTSPVNSSPAVSAWTPRLADVAGTPWVVWAETNGGVRQARVKRWDGTAWTAVGGALGANVQNPAITAVNGTAFVAWSEVGTPSTIRVARWTAGAWQTVQVGSQSVWNLDNQKNAFRPRLTAVGTTLWVVWHELDSSGGYYQVKWRSYNTVTASAAGSGIIAYDAAKQGVDPDVATVAGEPWVVYSETNSSGVSTIRVRTPSAGRGTELNVTASQPAYGPAIGVGADNMPHIAFREQTAGCWQVRTRRWTGSTWLVSGGTTLTPPTCAASSVGGGTAKYPDSLPNVGDPSIAVVGSTAWLTWAELNAAGNVDMVVARYAAGTDQWIRTDVLDVATAADAVTGHLVGSGGRTYAASAEWDGGNWEIRVAGS